MSILIGVISALVCIGLFVLGFTLGLKFSQKTSAPLKYSQEEIEEQKKDTAMLIAEQKAFTNMLNYNPDVAYGQVSVDITSK